MSTLRHVYVRVYYHLIIASLSLEHGISREIKYTHVQATTQVNTSTVFQSFTVFTKRKKNYTKTTIKSLNRLLYIRAQKCGIKRRVSVETRINTKFFVTSRYYGQNAKYKRIEVVYMSRIYVYIYVYTLFLSLLNPHNTNLKINKWKIQFQTRKCISTRNNK